MNPPIPLVSPATVTTTGAATGPSLGGSNGGDFIAHSVVLLHETSIAGTDRPFISNTTTVAPGAVAKLWPAIDIEVPPEGRP